MTAFEIRYGGKTAITEFEGTLQEFVGELATTNWWVLDGDPVAIQTSLIDSVKVVG